MEVSAKSLELTVPLPPAVEELLQKICKDQNKPPVDAGVRLRLAERGEAGSIEILHKVARNKIKKTLGGYIITLLDLYPLQSSPRKSPRVVSSTSSPNRSSAFSPSRTVVRVYNSPKEAVILPCSIGTDVPSSVEIGRAEKEALGKLEFRKQFLILNYTGGNELHTVTTAEEISSLSNLPIILFEERVWQIFGLRYADPEDRRLYYDWDSGKTYLYDCHVCPQGSYRFKGPFLSRPKTHLQKVLGDDNILRVKFSDESNEKFGIGMHDHSYAGYSKIAREGIIVGLRRYQFFVFKDGGKEEKKKNPTASPVKCYFIRTHSDAWIDKNASEPYILSNKTMSEARRLFMHAHTGPSIANYMARFSLMLSKTYSLKVDLTSVQMKIDADICCEDKDGNCIYRDGKPLIHTDGTGEISEDLALLCPKNIHEGMCINNSDAEIIQNRGENVEGIGVERLGSYAQEPPMLIQCRLFNKGYAIKGTFLVNKQLDSRTISVRKSMVKVEPDPNLLAEYTVNSLEIVGTSNRPKRTNLSRNLIALLTYGGVPESFFKDILDEALRETDGAFRNKHAALKVAMIKWDQDSTIARMILSGIPLEEPYLRHRIGLLLKEQKTSLKDGKLYVPESYYLMGTADPTGELESDEVCIVLENGQVSGKVLVYRNPGLHFGDVHVLKAKYVEKLESVVGNAKFAIFFSTKGPRSVADEIGGGDFDGDMYWVSRNPKLLEYFKPSEPWNPNPSTRKVKNESKRLDQFSEEEFEDELFKLYLTTRFQPSFAMGEAADSWLALMDRFLMLEDDCIDEKNHVKDNIIKLIDLYYDALDAPKKGAKIEIPKDLKAKTFPHYMEKKNSFTSKSILGKIYDIVNEYQSEDDSMNIDIWKLPHFEAPQDSSRGWEFYYEEYRKDMSNAMKIQDRDHRYEAADAVKRKYKRLLYGAEEFEHSTKNVKDIYNEALAIYNACYDYAKSQGNASLCSFAWSVAGSALYSYQISKQVGQQAFLCLPSALREAI